MTDGSEYPQLSQLTYEYLKQSKGADDKMYEYFATQPNADSLYVKLVEELDRCILSYFAFHWSQASLMITRVVFLLFHKGKKYNQVAFNNNEKNYNKNK